jgi:hypothetical protein
MADLYRGVSCDGCGKSHDLYDTSVIRHAPGGQIYLHLPGDQVGSGGPASWQPGSRFGPASRCYPGSLDWSFLPPDLIAQRDPGARQLLAR